MKNVVNGSRLDHSVFCILYSVFRCALASVTVQLAIAQPTVGPTPAPVGPPRGQEVGGYNILNSFETGYRFRGVRGDIGKYRSDVNFHPGVRLLASELRVNSRDGRGRLFDELLIRTQGLGNDPYQFSSLRLEKNRFFRYDFTWRLQDYFNPALPIAAGLHFMNTERRLQDHDIVLLPQSRVRLIAGFSRNSQDGPALSTVHLFTPPGDEFALFAPVRRLQNTYRLGGEAHFLGTRFTVLRGWNNFSETTRYESGPDPGLAPGPIEIEGFRRTEPYSGSSPYWNLNLFRDGRLLAANARFTYVDGRRGVFFDEVAAGTDRFGAAAQRQILVAGNGRRPMSAGNFVLSAFPDARVTVNNQTSFFNRRMEGDNFFRELSNATFATELLNFQHLGVRAITNTTDVHWRARTWIGLFGGYRFSTRRVRSVQQIEFFGTPEAIRAEQDSRLHAGVAGLRFQPIGPLTLNVDAEIGRAGRPFFPISERNYHLLGARAQYRLRTLLLSAGARANYNFNSESLAHHSFRNRDYMVHASWTPRTWFGFDATYSKIHVDTLSALAYFVSFNLIADDRSFHVSNIHSGTLMAHFGLLPRTDLSFGYVRVQDVGDGRDTPLEGRPVAGLPALVAAQVFPLTYETPLARLSVRLHQKLRLNVGYQFYHYAERFTARRYDAHTGYGSVLWSF